MNSVNCLLGVTGAATPCNSLSVPDWDVISVHCKYARAPCQPTQVPICDSARANSTIATCFPASQVPASMDTFVHAAAARFSPQSVESLTTIRTDFLQDNCSGGVVSQEAARLNSCLEFNGYSSSYTADKDGIITWHPYSQLGCKDAMSSDMKLPTKCLGRSFFHSAPSSTLVQGILLQRDGSCTTNTITGKEDDSVCDPSQNPDICCVDGESYPGTDCSPPVDNENGTAATLTNNDFSDGGDGGGQSSCDNQFHDNSELIVALSTGWYAGGSRCGQLVDITVNGVTVSAKVVDECDSRNGCDSDHAFQKPCRTNIVDASKGVFDALNIDLGQTQELSITWKDHSE